MQKSTKDKIYGILQIITGTTVVSVLVAFLNWQIQNREIEIKELEQLGKFVEHALNENIAVRQRFAVYFATVSRSKKMRDRWEEYSNHVNDEKIEKQKEVDRMEKEITKKVAPHDEKIQKTRLEIQELEVRKKLATEATEKERIKKGLLEKEIALEKAKAQLEEIKEELSQLQHNISDAKAELVFPYYGFRATAAPWLQSPTGMAAWGLPKKEINRTITGWVYLGKYDTKQQFWLSPYFDIPGKYNPKEVVKKNLLVTAILINVRTGVPIGYQRFGKVFDVLKRGETVTVLEIENWKKTGSIWARVRYLR